MILENGRKVRVPEGDGIRIKSLGDSLLLATAGWLMSPYSTQTRSRKQIRGKVRSDMVDVRFFVTNDTRSYCG